jgi:hypothetical protein
MPQPSMALLIELHELLNDCLDSVLVSISTR